VSECFTDPAEDTQDLEDAQDMVTLPRMQIGIEYFGEISNAEGCVKQHAR
jgi:hypothetical protein